MRRLAFIVLLVFLASVHAAGICCAEPGDGRGERVTVVVLPDIQREEREPWAGLGPVYVVLPLLDMGMKK